jgi:LemA protein
VRDKNRVLAAWSDIDVQLKRRHDLIPKLIDAVKQYAAYESSTLSAITTLRSQSEDATGIDEKGQIEGELSAKLHQLIALAEDYPDLKANHSFLDLQKNLTDVENHIQYARRYYNGTVRNLNIRVDSFPDMLIARFFRFIPAEFFDFDEAV